MSTPILAAVASAAVIVGYLLGRIRPLDRLDTWVWRQMAFGGPWLTGSKPRQAVLLAAHALNQPEPPLTTEEPRP